MTLHRQEPGAPPAAGRRTAPADPRDLTAAFRRYVDAVQAHSDASVDVDAALTLASEVMGHRRGAAVDASLAEAHGTSMRELATAVRRAGPVAVAHPGLLGRAVVLARTLERTGAGRRAAERQRAPAGTSGP